MNHSSNDALTDIRSSFVLTGMAPSNKTTEPNGEGQDSLGEIAAEWFVRRREPDFTGEEEHAFQVWLTHSTEHPKAYARIESVWQRYEQLPIEAVEPASPALATVRSMPSMARTQPRLPAKAKSRRPWAAAMAASALLAVGVGSQLDWGSRFAEYQTALTERRSIELSDGSRVELAGGSALSVKFDDEGRHLRLHKGEAYFEVAPDTRRPFVVESADGSTRALGTAFDVARVGDAVTVTVTEHSVGVQTAQRAATLASGYRLRYEGSEIGDVEPADLDSALAWRRDRLVFRRATLSEVVSSLERYRHGRIFIASDELKAMPVTAVFDVRQTDAAIDTIAATLPVQVSHFGNWVLLSPQK